MSNPHFNPNNINLENRWEKHKSKKQSRYTKHDFKMAESRKKIEAIKIAKECGLTTKEALRLVNSD